MPKGPPRQLSLAIFRIDVIGIPQHRDAGERRRELVQELKPLGGKVGGHEGNAGDVAARAGEARHQPGLYGIVAHCHDDWDRTGRRAHEWCHVTAEHVDEIGLRRDQLAREHGQALRFALSGAGLEHNVLTFHVSELA